MIARALTFWENVWSKFFPRFIYDASGSYGEREKGGRERIELVSLKEVILLSHFTLRNIENKWFHTKLRKVDSNIMISFYRIKYYQMFERYCATQFVYRRLRVQYWSKWFAFNGFVLVKSLNPYTSVFSPSSSFLAFHVVAIGEVCINNSKSHFECE